MPMMLRRDSIKIRPCKRRNFRSIPQLPIHTSGVISVSNILILEEVYKPDLVEILHFALDWSHRARTAVPTYVQADGGVMAWPSLPSGFGGATSQGSCMLLLLTLPHDGLTPQPLTHRLLIAGSHLLIHLHTCTHGHTV